MSGLLTAVVGLIGIVIGALLGGYKDLALARRQEQRKATEAETGLAQDLENARETLCSHLERDVYWWWEASSAPSLKAWEQHRGALAFLPEDVLAQLEVTFDSLRDLNARSAREVAEADAAQRDAESGRSVKLPEIAFGETDATLVTRVLKQVDKALDRLRNRAKARAGRKKATVIVAVAVAVLVIAASITVPLTLPGDPLSAASIGNVLQRELDASSAACTPAGTSNDEWDCTVGFGLVRRQGCKTATLGSSDHRGAAALAMSRVVPIARAACEGTPSELHNGLEEWKAAREAKNACALAHKIAASLGRLGSKQRGGDPPTPAHGDVRDGLAAVLDRTAADTREVCP
jgi:hypothetical protein